MYHARFAVSRGSVSHMSTATKPAAGVQTPARQLPLLTLFGDSFLDHHAGRIISDPETAIVELVANCSDAGADRVDILWPDSAPGTLSIEDNGIGMTAEEFQIRWRTLNYDRRKELSNAVEFPAGVRHRPRVAFGRAGIGRHAMFCFATEYFVETRRAGRMSRWRVRRSNGLSPFDIDLLDDGTADNSGTKIWTTVSRQLPLSPESVAELIGARFVADPDFNIAVNSRLVALTDLEERCEKYSIPVEGIGTIGIRRYEGERPGRTSKQNGIAFWVNDRLCGVPSWEIYDRPLLDARTAAAKRYTYVVEANVLDPFVKKDWSGFHAAPQVNAVRKAVSEFIGDNLRGLLSDIRRERKKAALAENRQNLRHLPPIAQETIAKFADEMQVQCPTITERDLGNAVEVLAKLEKARSGYSLLEKLSGLKTDDFDQLDAILEEWTVTDIKRVLGELRYRLDLISQLEELVDRATTDELHDLQPLFERGLWLFGPEFESVSFVSNRTLATIVREHFGGAALTRPNSRPDFVVLPDASIGVYACDSFDESHDVNGYAKIVIVELKKGGFAITGDEKDQANRYARQLRKSGKVKESTIIICHVLGSSLGSDARLPLEEGATRVVPRTYNDLLRAAHARTFHLLKQLKSTEMWRRPSDAELEAVLHEDGALFEDVHPVLSQKLPAEIS